MEVKGDFNNDKIINKISKPLLQELSANIEKKRRQQRAMFLVLVLELVAIGYGWYYFGWHMVVLISMLLWVINIKVRND